MIMNDLMNVKQIIEAWNDISGDINIIHDAVENCLKVKDYANKKERKALESILEQLEEITAYV
ncbi:MAG: hypothetical protein IJG55_12255 [Synergistaceae bacterium]|nr:hypothetical protein [Synergistaceae bacterium]